MSPLELNPDLVFWLDLALMLRSWGRSFLLTGDAVVDGRPETVPCGPDTSYTELDDQDRADRGEDGGGQRVDHVSSDAGLVESGQSEDQPDADTGDIGRRTSPSTDALPWEFG